MNKKKNKVDINQWLLTYSDMVTLLLTFFIVLLSMSTVNMNLFEALKQGLRSDIIGTEKQITPLAEIKLDLDSLLEEEKEIGLVSINLNKDGLIMQFASSAFYQSGKAQVNDAARKIINKVIAAMKKINYYKFNVDIEGHTDDVPINTNEFPSNWELSVSRASNIVKYLISEGIEADRLKAAGYADTKPVVSNLDSLGTPIYENRAKNRRIVIKIW